MLFVDHMEYGQMAKLMNQQTSNFSYQLKYNKWMDMYVFYMYLIAWQKTCVILVNSNHHTSGSLAAVKQHFERLGCAWRGSTSPGRCTPPSPFRGCGPKGSDAASLLSAADWDLEEEGWGERSSYYLCATSLNDQYLVVGVTMEMIVLKASGLRENIWLVFDCWACSPRVNQIYKVLLCPNIPLSLQ